MIYTDLLTAQFYFNVMHLAHARPKHILHAPRIYHLLRVHSVQQAIHNVLIGLFIKNVCMTISHTVYALV